MIDKPLSERPPLLERLRNEFGINLVQEPESPATAVLTVPVTKHYTRNQWAAVRDITMQLAHDSGALAMAATNSTGPLMSVAPKPDTDQLNQQNSAVTSKLSGLHGRCQALESEVQFLRSQQTPLEQWQASMEVHGLSGCLQKWEGHCAPDSADSDTQVNSFLAVRLSKSISVWQVCMLLLCLVVTTSSVPLTFYDCGASRSSYPLIVPKTIECQLRKTYVVYKTSVDVYTIRDEPLNLPAYHSHIRKRQICTYYSIAFGKGITKDETTIHPVLPLTCKRAVRYGTWQHQTLFGVQDNVWATKNHLELTDSYCCFDYCTMVENLVVEKR